MEAKYIVAKDLHQAGIYKGYGFETLTKARKWSKDYSNSKYPIYKLIE